METWNKKGAIKRQSHKSTSEWPKKTQKLPFFNLKITFFNLIEKVACKLNMKLFF